MQTWYRVAAGAIGWFVIGLHYYLIASRPDVGLAEAAIACCLLHHPDRHRSLPWWLLYPVGYAAFSLLHGAVTGFSPIPSWR